MCKSSSVQQHQIGLLCKPQETFKCCTVISFFGVYKLKVVHSMQTKKLYQEKGNIIIYFTCFHKFFLCSLSLVSFRYIAQYHQVFCGLLMPKWLLLMLLTQRDQIRPHQIQHHICAAMFLTLLLTNLTTKEVRCSLPRVSFFAHTNLTQVDLN